MNIKEIIENIISLIGEGEVAIWIAVLAIIGIIFIASCIIGLVVIGAIVVIYMMTRKVYRVDYCGMKEHYKGAKDAYKAGETVKFYFRDAESGVEYRFYRDGKPLSVTRDKSKGGLVITFVMPAHDIKLSIEKEEPFKLDSASDENE
ncbi:MAG: hypothetical protein IJB49_04630 [Clostridia bacterium]|nr:hypothetical protein [Clostridia bacterium]